MLTTALSEFVQNPVWFFIMLKLNWIPGSRDARPGMTARLLENRLIFLNHNHRHIDKN
jgi:hypothetical protein